MLSREGNTVGSGIFSSGKFLGFGELGKSQIKLQIFSERGRIAESMDKGMRMLYQDMRIPPSEEPTSSRRGSTRR